MKRESWLWRNRWTILVVVVLLLIVAQMSAMDEAAEVVERDQYCDMVKLHLQTRGEHGWPDYRQIYGTECQ